MKICLVGSGNLPANPRIGALARSLEIVGHTVVVVSPARQDPSLSIRTRRVPARVPDGAGAIGGAIRRAQSSGTRSRSLHRRLVQAIVEEGPDLIYVFSLSDMPWAIEAADRSGAAVVRSPSLPSAGEHDIVNLAPANLRLSSSPAGPGGINHTPLDKREPWSPEPGRHTGIRVVLAYRATDTTPARYLRSAMVRAGIDVLPVETIDWKVIPPDVACVVIVESPYPALDVIGQNSDIPVLLWAHHGEHHTDAQLRIVERYGVDAILLAHSWHLAHRFPVPVHRFPFGVPEEILDSTVPWRKRSYDVAFVGSLSSESSAHRDRRQILRQVSEVVGEDRVVMRSEVSPEELGATYSDARVVINDGGTRHHPITMRVFEAAGSGSTLVTTPTPGLDQLMSPGDDFVEMDVSDAGSTIAELLVGSDGEAIARRGFQTMHGRHRYDHRVDELLQIATMTEHRPATWTQSRGSSPLALAVDAELEIGSIAAIGAPGFALELPRRAVWSDVAPGERTYDAVVIGRPESLDEAVLDDAVRFVIFDASSQVGPQVHGWLAANRSEAELSSMDGIVTADLKAPGYRISTLETS